MSSEGLPVDGVIGTDIVLKARSTQQATNDAKSNLSADSVAQSADALSKDNKSSIQRFTNATVNRPANGTGGLLTMPIDGGPSCSYFAILIARQAWEGTSNSVNPSVVGDPMDIPDGCWIDLRLEMPMGELTGSRFQTNSHSKLQNHTAPVICH
ncbi:hypothetical protein JEQ07_11120 [Serratia proteamaculans]|uniref:Uncharacterized protein n=1 Tax=Serratia proteamaculans TaxID=28151 RepID=A0ABS0TU15_SERPR|nr:hypothetical protein [Serratia proteamaculans]MBI6180943.1 hypothetical protein [Serratia proteamaculans]